MTSKLSSKNQMVIPKILRERLALSGGDEILMIPRGNVVILMKKPDSFTEALSGIRQPRRSRGAANRSVRKLSLDRTKW